MAGPPNVGPKYPGGINSHSLSSNTNKPGYKPIPRPAKNRNPGAPHGETYTAPTVPKGNAAATARAAAAAKKTAAAKAAAKKRGRKGSVPATTTPDPNYGITGATGTTVPATNFDPSATPEDQALSGNYDPNQFDFMDSSKIEGMAGKVQLPNALHYANNMANLQYGNKIQQIAGRIKGLTNALPGAIEAIDKAFGNLDMQRAQTAPAPVTSGAGVANLFGGNTGAAAVAANQAQQAQATADNQAGIASDRTQANATREADWKARLQLLSAQQVGQGRADLTGAIGERDAAKKGYFDQGLKMRGDMISQAIGNQGALNNQKIATALASGQLEGLHLSNEQKTLLNKQLGIQVDALPDQLATSLAAGKQGIVSSVLHNQIDAATARAQLKQLTDPKTNAAPTSLGQVRAQGGDGVLYAMILPQGSLVQNSTTGAYQFNGNPNTYFRLGVENIMKSLKNTDRKKARDYVSNKIQLALNQSGNTWTYKNGKFVRVAK